MRDKLSKKKVADLKQLIVPEPATIGPDESIPALLKKLISDPRTRHVYVIDGGGELIGSVRLNAVVRYLFPHETVWETMSIHAYHEQNGKETVRDIMDDDPPYVRDSTPVSEMAQIMIGACINELPVVDDRMRVIGEVNMLEAVKSYLDILKEEGLVLEK